MDNIISNCPLCEEHSLHLLGNKDEGGQLLQCIWCGYVSSSKFIGKKEDNEEYKKLTDDMKNWSKEAIGRIWIPSMFTLPDGMIYPDDIDGVMKWKLAEMKSIPIKEQKNYPIEGQEDKFYEKKYDTDNPIVYDNFYEVMSVVNERVKDKVKQENDTTKVKLPSLSAD